jgi:hypothetical protein
MTTDEATARVERAGEILRAAQVERNEAIRAAHQAGLPMRRIAEAVGVTVGRVHQIIHEERA